MASVLKWWRDFVGGWRGFRASLGFASRFGRIYGLRERGSVEEALNLALALAADIKASPRSWNPTDRIMAAAIVDELAQRLDRREVAYDALKHALDVIDEEKNAAGSQPPSETGGLRVPPRAVRTPLQGERQPDRQPPQRVTGL